MDKSTKYALIIIAAVVVIVLVSNYQSNIQNQDYSIWGNILNLFQKSPSTSQKTIPAQPKSIVVQTPKYSTLQSILQPIVDKTRIANGDCLSYALYYKDYLNKNYPDLDVRKIDLAGDCKLGYKICGDMEGMPHTYLIVNGNGGECIMDQTLLTCIQLRG